MGASGNRDCQWASRSVLKDCTEDVLTISHGACRTSLRLPKEKMYETRVFR